MRDNWYAIKYKYLCWTKQLNDWYLIYEMEREILIAHLIFVFCMGVGIGKTFTMKIIQDI